jgi:hypothetical protein
MLSLHVTEMEGFQNTTAPRVSYDFLPLNQKKVILVPALMEKITVTIV